MIDDVPGELPARLAPYAVTWDALKPGCIGEDRRCRCGVLYLRDRATAGMRAAGWEAAMGPCQSNLAAACVTG